MNSWIERDKAGNTKIHGIDRDHVLFPPRNCAFLVSSARKIVRRASRNEQSARNPFIYPVFQSEKPLRSLCSFLPCMRSVNRFRRQKSVHFFDCYAKFSSYLRGGERPWFEYNRNIKQLYFVDKRTGVLTTTNVNSRNVKTRKVEESIFFKVFKWLIYRGFDRADISIFRWSFISSQQKRVRENLTRCFTRDKNTKENGNLIEENRGLRVWERGRN